MFHITSRRYHRTKFSTQNALILFPFPWNTSLTCPLLVVLWGGQSGAIKERQIQTRPNFSDMVFFWHALWGAQLYSQRSWIWHPDAVSGLNLEWKIGPGDSAEERQILSRICFSKIFKSSSLSESASRNCLSGTKLPLAKETGQLAKWLLLNYEETTCRGLSVFCATARCLRLIATPWLRHVRVIIPPTASLTTF